MSLPKQWKQWKNADLGRTKQNLYRWKGFDESYSKLEFLLNLSHYVKSTLWAFMSNLPKPLTKYGHVTWPWLQITKIFIFRLILY